MMCLKTVTVYLSKKLLSYFNGVSMGLITGVILFVLFLFIPLLINLFELKYESTF